jgi:hypothetical protein
MKPIQVATLLIRYGCIWAFVDSLVPLVELPADIYGILNAQSDYLVTQREIALAMLFARFFIYAGTGTVFLIFARPIARCLIKGFDDDTSA